ncbi:MAG: xanthine dehydrogenase accessory protein XdhC [Opitutaceae bacterium]|nr:xanthine dehydrogenase accessory protein XdhC [Opitutaceae bacterium]
MADSAGLFAQLAALENEGAAFVLVVLVEAVGSTPQDAGARMIVTAAGRLAGTVGGGRVEAQAIAVAQELLTAADRGRAEPRLVHWSLKADVGMTCGGTVKLYFEPHASRTAAWPIVIFGAGHIAQALVPVLLPLSCSLTVCDSRAEWLGSLPQAANLRTLSREQPADLVPELPAHAFVLCMTKGHTTDRPILQRALLERSFPFLGVIGSDAKAAVLRRELIAAGVPAARAAEFHCPVGLPFGSNHPHEIALSIAAQLLQERDRWAAAATREPA